MEVLGLPLATALWLFIPMPLTILLSLVSYLAWKRREQA